MALESGPLSEASFQEFADDVVLFLHVTTRIDGKKNDDLLSKKGGRGFPYLVYMNADGDVVASPDSRSVDSFKSGLSKIEEYDALVAKAEGGDAAAQLELFEKRMDLGHFDAAEAKARMDKLAITDEAVRKRLEGKLVTVEFNAFMASLTKIEDLDTHGSKLVAMMEADRIPSGQSALQFWNMILTYADRSKNADLFEKGIDGIVQILGEDDPRAANFKQRAGARLEQLRKEAGEKKDG